MENVDFVCFKERMSFFQGHFLKNISPNTSTRRESLRPRPKAAARARPSPGPARPGPSPGLARAQVGPEQTFKNNQNRIKRDPGGSVWAQTLSKRHPEAHDHFPSPPGPKNPIKKNKNAEHVENPDFSPFKVINYIYKLPINRFGGC